jgi:hypothetical protein
MAVKKSKNPIIQESNSPIKAGKKIFGLWMSVGWVLLLLGGLAHMLPEQMAPLLKFSLWGVSLQVAIGTVSVILALNFLLDEEDN